MNKKNELIKRRDYLQSERNKLLNKKPNKNELYLYVCGIALTAAVSSILFLETMPVLIYSLSFLYTFAVPTIYTRNNIVQDNKLKDELVSVENQIEILEKQEQEDNKKYEKIPKKLFEDKKDTRTALEVVSDGLKKLDTLHLKPIDDKNNSSAIEEDGPKLSLRK